MEYRPMRWSVPVRAASTFISPLMMSSACAELKLAWLGVGRYDKKKFACWEIRLAGMILPGNCLPVVGSLILVVSALKFPVRMARLGTMSEKVIPWLWRDAS